MCIRDSVYIMHDKTGTVIYVGKAKKLKNRVSQYFQDSSAHTPKTRQMVAHIDHFDEMCIRDSYNGSYVFIDMALCLVITALIYKPLKKYINGTDLAR